MRTMGKESSAIMAPPTEKIARLDELAKQYDGLLVEAETPFSASLSLATAMGQLRELLTPDVMAPVMQLMNSPLGFLTDRTGRPNAKGEVKPPYDVSVVRDCLIEGILRGFAPVNNEINIIAGRCYLAKNGLSRKVKNFPGLTEYKDGFTVPRTSEKGAVIACWASWKIGGQEHRIEREFAVKGDSFATADSYLGKAQRKLYCAVYERLSGHLLPEGEVTDEELSMAKDVTPRRAAAKPNFPQQPERAPAEGTPPVPTSAATEGPEVSAPQKPKEAPEFVAETKREELAVLLHKHKMPPVRFVQGLRALERFALPTGAQFVADLPEEFCAELLKEDFDELLLSIAELDWK